MFVLPARPQPVKRKADFGAGGNDEPSPSSAKIDDQMEERECPNHKNEVFDAFSRLKSEKILFDFVIKLEDEEIPVHRVVLASSSKYYEAMLTHDTVEKEAGEVKIHGVGLTAGIQCIDFMYTGKTKFSLKNPEKLIYAAELMQLPALTDMYFEFLKEKLSVKDCLKYIYLAETFSRQSFVKVFEKFSIQNFADIVESDDFADMSQTLLEQCLESVPGSGREAENIKWKAISTWVNKDVSNWKSSFLKLFRMLNLDHFSEDFLRTQMMVNPLVRKSTLCKNLILEALLIPGKPRTVGCFNRRAQYIIACDSTSRLLHRLDLDSRRWKRFARIPADIYQKPLDIASVHGEVYLTSGDAVSKFRDGKLIHLTDTGFEPSYHQCIVRGVVIYIISSERTCKYNTSSNTWEVLEVKHSLGKGFFTTSSDRFVYAMGGYETEREAREFSFTSEIWEPIAKMRLEREFGAAVWYEKKVYALGGSVEHLNSTEFYSPRSGMWSTLSDDVNCSHYKCKAFTIDGKIYIVGGPTRYAFMRSYPRDQTKCRTCQRVLHSEKPVPSVLIIDFKTLKRTVLPSFETKSGLACAVYFE